MRHGTSNANGHGMPCDEGFPISAASTDTVGRTPPTCQHLMLRVSFEEGSSLFCTLLFQKNLDRSKLWDFLISKSALEAARCTLHVACCTLHVARCMSHVACCDQFLVR